MATVTNYYEELNLSAEMSIEEIDSKLAQLETVWNQRLFNEPEKANKILTLISEAKACFATSEAKAQYDESLYKTPTEDSAPVDDRRVNFAKWYGQAVEYFNNQQYDLAKTAIEKAGLYYDTSDENAEYLSYAADIYRFNKDYETAFIYINEAIIIEPKNWTHISIKGMIHYSLGQYGEACDCLQKANSIACSTGDSVKESYSQGYLASVLFYGLKDYVSAETAAERAVELGDTTGIGSRIIAELDQPFQVTLDELKNYDQEPSPYESTIIDLVKQIIGSGLTPESEFGWVMTNKSYFGEYNPNKDGFDEENTTSFDYYLSPDGSFICKRKLEKEYFKQGQMPIRDIDESSYKCSLLNIMKEMDFEGTISYNSGSSWHEHGTSIEYIGYQGPSALRNNGALTIKRKSRRKGQELYKRLKAIVDSAAAYIEECNRINSAFNAEYEPQQQRINSEYAEKKGALLQEQNNAIDNAKKNEPQRNALLHQINSMKKELSSLGLFAVKKKKELQSRIDELERNLADLHSVDEVADIFKRRIAELDQQEKNELDQLEKEIRAKYPLPCKQ